MIAKEEARRLVINSLNDLKTRNVYLSADDIAADVINVACKWILEQFPIRPKIQSSPQIDFVDNYMKFHDIAAVFPNSIGNEYPNIKQNAENIVQNICLNLGWRGMPTFLDDYFYKKHGITNDSSKEIKIFMSTYHKRYQFGQYIEQSAVPRKVELSFSNGGQNLGVSIIPSLSYKSAQLQSQQNNCKIYNGEGYRFVIYFDNLNRIRLFSLELLERQLKIEYYK